MDKPKVSVIVPIYNVEPYLRKCVDSILAQTLKELEIILVDDGSTDNGPAICDEYATFDSRVKVIHKINGGLSAARNAGMKIMTGEYVGFVDGDDWIDKAMFEILYLNAKTYDADVSFCNFASVIDGVVQQKSLKVDPGYLDLSRYDLLAFYTEYYVTNKVPYNVCTSIFKTALLSEHSLIFFDNAIVFAEDTLFIFEVFLWAKKVARTDDLLYFYLRRADSLFTSAQGTTKLIKYVSLFQELKNYTVKAQADKSCASPAIIYTIFWEFWVASLFSYIEKTGKQALPEMFSHIEAKTFLKAVAFSFFCGKANRLYSKMKNLSFKNRLHLRLMAFFLLSKNYKRFIEGYL